MPCRPRRRELCAVATISLTRHTGELCRPIRFPHTTVLRETGTGHFRDAGSRTVSASCVMLNRVGVERAMLGSVILRWPLTGASHGLASWVQNSLPPARTQLVRKRGVRHGRTESQAGSSRPTAPRVCNRHITRSICTYIFPRPAALQVACSSGSQSTSLAALVLPLARYASTLPTY